MFSRFNVGIGVVASSMASLLLLVTNEFDKSIWFMDLAILMSIVMPVEISEKAKK